MIVLMKFLHPQWINTHLKRTKRIRENHKPHMTKLDESYYVEIYTKELGQ